MANDEKDRFGDKLRDVEKAREDKFFADRDRELLQKLKGQTQSEQEQTLQDLARSRCPRCGERLVSKAHLDVEVDECPSRHGIWLDDGELEKLTTRESSGWLARVLGRSS